MVEFQDDIQTMISYMIRMSSRVDSKTEVMYHLSAAPDHEKGHAVTTGTWKVTIRPVREGIANLFAFQFQKEGVALVRILEEFNKEMKEHLKRISEFCAHNLGAAQALQEDIMRLPDGDRMKELLPREYVDLALPARKEKESLPAPPTEEEENQGSPATFIAGGEVTEEPDEKVVKSLVKAAEGLNRPRVQKKSLGIGSTGSIE